MKAFLRRSLILALVLFLAGGGVPVGAQEKPRDSERLFEAARKTFEADLLREAQEKCRRYLSDYPDTAHLRELLAVLCAAYARLGEYDGGLEYLKGLAARTTDAERARAVEYAVVDLVFRRREFTKAVERLETLLGKTPETAPELPEVLFLYGLSLYYSGLFEKAASVFTRIQTDKTFGVKSTLYLSECLLELGKTDLSQRLVDGVLAEHSQSQYYPYSLFLSGKINYIQGRSEEAEKAFDKAMESDTTGLLKEKIAFDRAALYRRFQKFDLSNEQLRMLNRWYPASSYRSEISLMFVRNLISQGKYDEAVSEVDFSLQHYRPEAVNDLLFLKGEALMQRRSFREALALFVKLAEENPGYRFYDECVYRVSYCLMRLNRYAEAVEYLTLKRAAATDIEMKRLYLKTIADCYLYLKNYPPALRFYNNALQYCRTTPQEIEIHLLMGKTYYLSQDWTNAMKTFDQLAHESGDAQTATLCRYYTGWVSLRQGDVKNALLKWRATAKQRNFPALKVKAFFQLGNLFFDQGKLKQAARYYAKIVSFYAGADHKIVEFSLFRLAYCHRRLGEDDAADRALKRLLKAYPRSRYAPQIHFSLGCAAFDKGLYFPAQRHFGKVVRDYASDSLAPEALFWSARCLFELNDLRAARGSLETLLSGKRPSAFMLQAELLLARVLGRLGEFGAARKVLEAIPESEGGTRVAAGAWLELGQILFAHAEYGTALDCFKRVPPDEPASVSAPAQYRAGLCCRQLGREEDALQYLLNVVHGYPKGLALRVQAAEEAAAICEKKGRAADALMLYNIVVEENPGRAQELRQRIGELQKARAQTPAGV